jgi:SM-20-related protein
MDKESLIVSLIERGWFMADGFLDRTLCQNLITDLKGLPLREAKIGRGGSEHRHDTIRNDSIYWMAGGTSSAQDDFLKRMDELMGHLNRELYLGLKQFEGHFAKYEEGQYYKKHSDQFVGSKERLVTTVTYLNSPAMGGELRVYNKENNELIDADVKPVEGRLICFLTSQIYHEVLPAQETRYSVAGWFRTDIT